MTFLKRSLILSFFTLTIFHFNVSAQSCCQLMTMDDYQILGGSAAFRNAHAEPLPFHFISLEGGLPVTFDAPDGTKAKGFFIKAKKKSNKWLFVYQEWWGLNDYIKRESEKYYTEMKGDVNVLAVDLYDGKVAAKREEAGKLMGGVKEPRLESIVKGAVSYAGKKAKIVSVGWCFGGGWSLRSALIEGKHAEGCIMYYGMPVKEANKLKMLNCDVLGFFAGKENWISPKVVEQFDSTMKVAGKSLTYKIYDADHAFANPSNPAFDKAASEDAHTQAIAYLQKKFELK